LSEQLATESRALSAQRTSFPKTAAFFDWSHFVVRQLDEIIWESKRLIFEAGFLLLVVYELAHYGKYLLAQWSG
jgi:hypothetical protein